MLRLGARIHSRVGSTPKEGPGSPAYPSARSGESLYFIPDEIQIIAGSSATGVARNGMRRGHSMRFFDVDRGRRVSIKEKSNREEGKRQMASNPPPQILTGNAKSIASRERVEARKSWFTGSAGIWWAAQCRQHGERNRRRMGSRPDLRQSALHLADAAIELIERPELREHLAEHGRRLAETLTLERMVDTYERTLGNL